MAVFSPKKPTKAPLGFAPIPPHSGFVHERPEPTTNPPILPRINRQTSARCQYCQQEQPKQWDGGACHYCGAPVEKAEVKTSHLSINELRIESKLSTLELKDLEAYVTKFEHGIEGEHEKFRA